jgi:2-C-methyl-D-erythritol 4-phosphate cytidylyltransferase
MGEPERDEGAPSEAPVWAIVLAAGTGARFGGEKQFIDVAGQRLVDLAVQTATSACDRVVLVLPGDHVWDGPPVDVTVRGGPDRRTSVRNGLSAISHDEGIVVVHQAANPLASQQLIENLVEAVRAGAPAAVPGLRPADVVRRVADGVAGDLLGRDELVLVQTPAAFRIEVLRAAHAAIISAVEDTALVSAAGYEVHVVAGDPRNIHVATPEDLELVRALLLTRSLSSAGDLRAIGGDPQHDDERRTPAADGGGA